MNTQQIMSFVKIAQELNQSNHVALKGLLHSNNNAQIGPAHQRQSVEARQASIDMIQQRSTLIHSLLEHLHQRLYDIQHSKAVGHQDAPPTNTLQSRQPVTLAPQTPVHALSSSGGINSDDLSQLALTCLHLLKKMDFDFAGLLQDVATQLESPTSKHATAMTSPIDAEASPATANSDTGSAADTAHPSLSTTAVADKNTATNTNPNTNQNTNADNASVPNEP
jgi:hypothetical protein